MEISIVRVKGVALRHLYTFFRNWDRLSDIIYWPVIDMVIWGLTTQWLQSSPQLAQSRVLMLTLTAIVFWQIQWQANQDITLSLLEEVWTNNLPTLFATPITLAEWIAGVLLVGLGKLAIAATVGLLGSWVLFQLNILTLGYLLLPFLLNLILFGWSIGFFVTGLIVRFGKKIQTFAWSIPGLFAPLSAVYFPVSAVPEWLRPAVRIVPVSYVFEGMRAALATGEVDLRLLTYSFLLNGVYLCGSLWFFCWCFRKKRERGLYHLL